jgi:hypothetical protein
MNLRQVRLGYAGAAMFEFLLPTGISALQSKHLTIPGQWWDFAP